MKRKIILLILSTFLLSVTLSYSQNLKSRKQDLADKLYEIELTGGDSLGYSREILRHLELSEGIKPGKYTSDTFDDVDRLNVKTDTGDYSPFNISGLSARRFSQITDLYFKDNEVLDVDPSRLGQIEFIILSYLQLSFNTIPAMYRVDNYIPADFYYIHFNNGLDGLKIINYFNSIGSEMRNRLTQQSLNFFIKDKFLKQLAINDSDEYLHFYSTIELVITGSDFHYNEGTDITIFFSPLSGASILHTIQQMRNKTKHNFSAKEIEIDIYGVKVNHLYTEDRRIYSFLFVHNDGTVFITNSLKSAEKIILTIQKKSSSLSDTPDYKYIRTIFPSGKNYEDGFFYLSEKFITNLLSPKYKIKEARRIKEEIKLSVLQKYLIYYYQIYGKLPLSTDDIIKSSGGLTLSAHARKELVSLEKYRYYSIAMELDRSVTTDWKQFRAALSSKIKSKGKKNRGQSLDEFIYNLKLFYKKFTDETALMPAQAIELLRILNKKDCAELNLFNGISLIPGSFSVKSDTFGKAGLMTPLIEIETDKISRLEEEEYRKFAENFKNSSVRFIAPIGIKLNTHPYLTLDSFIFYNKYLSSTILEEIIGSVPKNLHMDKRIDGEVLNIAFNVNLSKISKYLSFFAKDLSWLHLSDINDILSGEIQFHMKDALPATDFDISEIFILSHDDSLKNPGNISGLISWIFAHPIRITIPLKEKEKGKRYIYSLIDTLVSRSNDDIIKSESYYFSYKKTYIRTFRIALFGSIITRLYAAEKDNELHITTSEKHMKEILDITENKISEPANGNISIVYRPSEVTLEKESICAGLIENGLKRSRNNFGTFKLMSNLFPESSDREIISKSYENFGFAPICPLGGEYLSNKDKSEVRNSLYGNGLLPVLPDNDYGGGDIKIFLEKLFSSSEMRLDIKFSEKGVRARALTK